MLQCWDILVFKQLILVSIKGENFSTSFDAEGEEILHLPLQIANTPLAAAAAAFKVQFRIDVTRHRRRQTGGHSQMTSAKFPGL